MAPSQFFSSLYLILVEIKLHHGPNNPSSSPIPSIHNDETTSIDEYRVSSPNLLYSTFFWYSPCRRKSTPSNTVVAFHSPPLLGSSQKQLEDNGDQTTPYAPLSKPTATAQPPSSSQSSITPLMSPQLIVAPNSSHRSQWPTPSLILPQSY